MQFPPLFERDFNSILIDIIRLLPNLLVLMTSMWLPHLRSRFPHLVVADSDHLGSSYRSDDHAWPPIYAKLLPEVQALFKHRPYREASHRFSFSVPVELIFVRTCTSITVFSSPLSICLY
jgi:hypothetical protein